MNKLKLKNIILEILDEESEASKKAKSMGLTSMGFGRWGKDGKVTHKSDGRSLTPIQAKSNTVPQKSALKKVDTSIKIKPSTSNTPAPEKSQATTSVNKKKDVSTNKATADSSSQNNKPSKVAIEFAAKAHEEWRKNYISANGNTPRVKKNSDGTEGDINVPFEKLHPDWQKENLAAGKAAEDAVRMFPTDIEKAAEYIHIEWMKRNPKGEWNAAQHVPYEELSDEEKEKDRVQVRTMIKLQKKL